MSEAEFLGMMVIAAGALAAIITPIIRLNTSITKLNTALEYMQHDDATRDNRLNAHAKQLDEHEAKLVNHEARLNNLEK